MCISFFRRGSGRKWKREGKRRKESSARWGERLEIKDLVIALDVEGRKPTLCERGKGKTANEWS